ncbi:hypothetical protein [Halomicrococcus gelatinilyticus]|uniref:hypothetical protein n=1 Tax=Halomicrococcus gelatinilyticus TaxID=1702103 RepID=UPI002E101D74
MTDQEPSFAIPHRPERRYPRDGGVRYEGETIFRISPDADLDEAALVDLVESVLAEDGYTFGDWFDLPAPVYLVHDDERDTTFTVVVRYETVELHVLPETNSAGLLAFYRRLTDRSDATWSVTCESTPS